MAFAQIYECPDCGDVWRGVEMVEHIDCDRDDVWHEPMCSCGRSVRPKLEGGFPVWHALSEEEMRDEMFGWEDDTEVYDED